MITPGTLLQNRYLVQKQIGKGGMGVVYMATDQRFGSTVALKETKVDKPQLLKAFEREARLLNHLRHPALPRVSDHFTEDDGQFLIMEFIPGPDLSEMLKERGVPFSRVRVLEWADQLLDALDYLHTHEPAVIHRDIKPQNLKLTSRDRIMLLDFGLAKGASQASQMTATGSLFGYSFNYAPLEQMQGTGTDPRSDLYSLGATLYHLMTNVTPPDAITRATAVLNGEPDPLKLASDVQAQVSEPVARVIARSMAQNAAQRPQTAAEMREALRDAGKEVVAARIQTFAAPISGAGIEKQDKLTGALSATPASVVVASSISDSQSDSSSGSHYDMTVIEPVSAKHGPPTSLSHKREESSIITKMRPFEPAQTQPRGQGRVLGIVMSVMLLAIVAAVVYTFTRSSSPQNPSAQNVASQNDSTAASPTAPALDGSQASSASSQSPAGSQPSQQASSLPNDYSRSQPAASSANPQPVVATNENPTSVQPSAQGPSGNPVSSPNALTAEEERARKADEIRRERREKDEQDMRRQREALEEEQRRERERMYMERARPDRPPPPAGFPPPRRDGPPPPRPR
jgi:serine/threonine protein kinase